MNSDRYDELWHEFLAGDNYTHYTCDELAGIVRELMDEVAADMSPPDELYSYLEACLADMFDFDLSFETLTESEIQDWLDLFHKADEFGSDARWEIARQYAEEKACPYYEEEGCLDEFIDTVEESWSDDED